ncbi:MAG: hypothetical protein Q8Q38_00780 [bacterium]|nr:hypothetical protein [bacterium]
MSELLAVFIGIVSLFVFFLLVRVVTGWRFCALCAGVFATWAALLILHRLGIFQDLILAAPLLGASAVGVYYLAEKRASEPLHVFRLPFFLTLLFIAYLLLGAVHGYFGLMLFLASLWLLFGALHVYGRNPKVRTLVNHLIACCKNW